MTAKVCIVCGQDLPPWARVDKTTCGPACRSRLSRTRKVPCNTFATPLRAVAPRSGGLASKEPVWSQAGPLAASREAAPRSPCPSGRQSTGQGPRPTNPVILALVVALRDVEQRRSRGKVLIHVTTKRTAP
jgi:hypothetical protein